MPKVTGPLFSVDAHGALGKALTYQRRPGGASVYGYKKSKVPLTARQQWQRDLIKWCVYQWQQLSVAAKDAWEEKAKGQGQGQSGYSYFMKQRRGYLFDPAVKLYLPFYDTRLKDSSFLSMDSYGCLCTAHGTLWTPQGRSLNGTTDYLKIAAVNFGFNGATEITLICWAYVDTTDTGRILYKQWGTTLGDYAMADLLWNGSAFRFEVNMAVAGHYPQWLTPAVTTGWHFVSFAWKRNAINATDGTIVLDGVNVTPTYTAWGYAAGDTMRESSSNFLIGVKPVDFSDPLTGKVALARIDNVALSVVKRQGMYLATKWRY